MRLTQSTLFVPHEKGQTSPPPLARHASPALGGYGSRMRTHVPGKGTQAA